MHNKQSQKIKFIYGLLLATLIANHACKERGDDNSATKSGSDGQYVQLATKSVHFAFYRQPELAAALSPQLMISRGGETVLTVPAKRSGDYFTFDIQEQVHTQQQPLSAEISIANVPHSSSIKTQLGTNAVAERLASFMTQARQVSIEVVRRSRPVELHYGEQAGSRPKLKIVQLHHSRTWEYQGVPHQTQKAVVSQVLNGDQWQLNANSQAFVYPGRVDFDNTNWTLTEEFSLQAITESDKGQYLCARRQYRDGAPAKVDLTLLKCR